MPKNILLDTLCPKNELYSKYFTDNTPKIIGSNKTSSSDNVRRPKNLSAERLSRRFYLINTREIQSVLVKYNVNKIAFF